MKKLIIIIVLLNLSFAIGQNGKIKRANKNFDNYAFLDAIDAYENLAKEGLADQEIFEKLGDANYLNARYDKATQWYSKLVELENTTVAPDYLYKYAQSLKSLERYQESDTWMKKFQNAKQKDIRAIRFKENEAYLHKIKANSGRYSIKNLTLNSKRSDFSPSFYGKDSLVFSTARDTGLLSRKTHKWNKGSFLSLYTATVDQEGNISSLNKFSNKLNTKAHESSSTFTKDGKTIYFTRNNSKNGAFTRDNQGVSRLKIYRGELINGKWKKITPLPFNSDDYSVAHPALSEDQKTLYFSSDMPGSLGLSDIFKVAINEDGSFGTPQNLGNTINTEARETFPFMHKDILYFASDGHPGLGGLDVFAINFKEEKSQIVNVGEPINSKQDDFSFIINDINLGYFASNRENGIGDDDIYSFKENSPLNFKCYSDLTGIIIDAETKAILPNTTFQVLSSDGKSIQEGTSDALGKFAIQLDCNEGAYTIKAQKIDYENANTNIAITQNDPREITLALKKIPRTPIAAIGKDLIKHLELNPINFDLDKSNIRTDANHILDQVVLYLKEYPDVKISIESHTDVKASNAYNRRLSQARAKETYNILIEKGIAPDRMVYKGFGESKLVNDCFVWVECSEEENEKNRRSEIIVMQ